MSNIDEEKVDKKLDKLLKYQGKLEEYFEPARTELREAKALSNVTFKFGQTLNEIKKDVISKEIEKGTKSTVVAKTKANVLGVGGALKESVGGNRDRSFMKGGLSGAVGLAGVGALHGMGALTGNPLFNMAATAYGKRRENIIEKKNAVYAKQKEDKEIPEKPEKISKTVENADTSINEKLSEVNDKFDSANVEMAEMVKAIPANTPEQIQKIIDNTDLTNKILDNILKTTIEKNEDKKLKNDDIKKSKIKAEKPLPKIEQPKEEKGGFMSMVKSMFGKGGALIGSLSAVALPLIGSALAVAATAGIGAVIGTKIGQSVNEALGLKGGELADFGEKHGMLKSDAQIAQESKESVQVFKKMGELSRTDPKREKILDDRIALLEERRSKALKEEESFFGGLKKWFNDTVVGKDVVKNQSEELETEINLLKNTKNNLHHKIDTTKRIEPQTTKQEATKAQSSKFVKTEKMKKTKILSNIKQKYSANGELSVKYDNVYIDGKVNKIATKDYLKQMSEAGMMSDVQVKKTLSRIDKETIKKQNKTEKIVSAYEVSPTAEQAKTDAKLSNTPIEINVPNQTSTEQPQGGTSSGGSGLVPIMTGDNMDFGMNQYQVF